MVGNAVSIEDVGSGTKVYQWIDARCRAYHDESFHDIGIHLMDKVPWASLEQCKQHINMSSRNFELTGLQARDIVYGCEGPAPYFHPYFKVHLENRKGWQRQLGHDGPLESKWGVNCQALLWLLMVRCQATPITFISKKFQKLTCIPVCQRGLLSLKAASVAN